LGQNARAKPIKIGVKTGLKSGRGWHVIAGREANLHQINLHDFPANLAAARTGRLGPVALIRSTPRLTVIGGFQFPGAPAIDLGSIELFFDADSREEI
jgi:hypothetical protein